MKPVDIALNLRLGGIALVWIGPAILLVAGVAGYHSWQVANWPAATAQVLENNVEVSKKASGFSRRGRTFNDDYFTARCTYKFEVNGRSFTQTGICAEAFDRDAVEEGRRQYPVGGEVTIYHSPTNPDHSLLNNQPDLLGLSIGLIMGIVVIPVGLVLQRIAREMQPPPPVEVVAPRPVAVRAPPVPRAPSLPGIGGQPPIQAQKPRAARRLLRGLAVWVGLLILLFGVLMVTACLAQMAKGVDPAAAAKAGRDVQFAALVVCGSVALFGAFLMWLGLKRPRGAVAVQGRVQANVAAAAPGMPAIPQPASALAGAAMSQPLPVLPAGGEERSSETGIGNFIARCGPEQSGQMNSYLWGGALVVFALLCVLAPQFLEVKPGDQQMMSIISLSLAGLSMAFALGILWGPLFGKPQIIELYENGIVERLGDQVREIDFAAIERLQLQEWYEHRFAPLTFNVKAQVQGQQQLAFSTTLRGEAQAIIEYLASHIPQTEFVEFNATA